MADKLTCCSERYSLPGRICPACPDRPVSPSAGKEEIDRLKIALAEMTAERDEAINWSALIDRYGTDQFDDLADKWLAMESIQRVHNAVASVFSKWANDELMMRFKQHMTNSLHMAFVEGCLVGVRAAEAKAARRPVSPDRGLLAAVKDFTENATELNGPEGERLLAAYEAALSAPPAPGIAELVKEARDFVADDKIHGTGDEATDLIDRLATAIAAQGDGE